MSLLTEATARRNRLVHIQDVIDRQVVRLDASVGAKTGALASIDMTIHTSTYEQARELAAKFPKSLRVHATTLSGADYWDHEVHDERYSREAWHSPRTGDWSHSWTVGLVTLRVHCAADGVNKGINEAGIKRYRSFRRHAERLGLPVEFNVPGYANAVQSEEQLEQLLAA